MGHTGIKTNQTVLPRPQSPGVSGDVVQGGDLQHEAKSGVRRQRPAKAPGGEGEKKKKVFAGGKEKEKQNPRGTSERAKSPRTREWK